MIFEKFDIKEIKDNDIKAEDVDKVVKGKFTIDDFVQWFLETDKKYNEKIFN